MDAPRVDALPAHRVRARNLAPDSDNKIHDDTVARQFGFTGALVPGVEVFAYATHPFVHAWGEEFLRRGEIHARFRRPVYDGEEVDVTAEPGADGRYELNVTGPDGVVRATGSGRLTDDPPAVDVTSIADVPAPAERPTADAVSLAVRTVLATVAEPVDPEPHALYRKGVGDDLSLYERFAHNIAHTFARRKDYPTNPQRASWANVRMGFAILGRLPPPKLGLHNGKYWATHHRRLRKSA